MGDERKQTFDEASKRLRRRQKPGAHYYSGISIADTYLPAMRRPAYRRHDPHSGFRTELENRVDDGKGKGTSEPHEAESTEASTRGALLRNSEEAE